MKNKLINLQKSVEKFILKIDKIFIKESISFERGRKIAEEITILEEALEKSKK